MSEEKQELTVELRIPSPQQLIEAGVHFGHKTSRWHPKMKPYIFGSRNAVHIIDLEKTTAKLKEAVYFIAGLVEKGAIILFVGTKPAVKKIIKEGAEHCGMPYVVERWLGGTLTNFKTISKRLEYFKNLEKDSLEGGLQKYTKKEQIEFQKELEKLRINFEGIKNLSKLPELVFVADLEENKLAVREAKKMGIPVVAICDTNANPSLIDWPIPANNDAVPAVRIIIDTFVEAINKVKK